MQTNNGRYLHTIELQKNSHFVHIKICFSHLDVESGMIHQNNTFYIKNMDSIFILDLSFTRNSFLSYIYVTIITRSVPTNLSTYSHRAFQIAAETTNQLASPSPNGKLDRQMDKGLKSRAKTNTNHG